MNARTRFTVMDCCSRRHRLFGITLAGIARAGTALVQEGECWMHFADPALAFASIAGWIGHDHLTGSVGSGPSACSITTPFTNRPSRFSHIAPRHALA